MMRAALLGVAMMRATLLGLAMPEVPNNTAPLDFEVTALIAPTKGKARRARR